MTSVSGLFCNFAYAHRVRLRLLAPLGASVQADAGTSAAMPEPRRVSLRDMRRKAKR